MRYCSSVFQVGLPGATGSGAEYGAEMDAGYGAEVLKDGTPSEMVASVLITSVLFFRTTSGGGGGGGGDGNGGDGDGGGDGRADGWSVLHSKFEHEYIGLTLYFLPSDRSTGSDPIL